jgi:hypothetical protein
MVWADVVFNTLAELAIANEQNALNSPLIIESLFNGRVATQVLSIRRLMDGGASGIISLRRLAKDIRASFALLTRENYVCYDGLPYDYKAARQANFKGHIGEWGQGGIWMSTDGPQADGASELTHRQFDRLTGIDPSNRSREDRLPSALMTTIEKMARHSGADDLAKWSSTYLAHAGGPERRKEIAELNVTAN